MEQGSSNINMQPCYTGGSGALEGLLKQFLRCTTINEHLTAPKVMKRGNDWKEHLRKVEEYINVIGFDESSKCAYLINSLEESIQYELYSQLEYSSNSKDFTWLCGKLQQMLRERRSSARPLMQLLKTKQGPEQPLKEFITDIRVNAIKIMGVDCDSQQREEFMILAFLNSLHNRRTAVALKQLNPKTLDDCFTLVKKEITLGSNDNIIDDVCAITIKDNKSIESLENQIRHLQHQVNYLLSIVNKNENPMPRQSYAYVTKSKPATPQ